MRAPTKVKPLVWELIGERHWSAQHSGRRPVMTVLFSKTGSWHIFAQWMLEGPTGGFRTDVEAKAAAQREWDAFIISAIQT